MIIKSVILKNFRNIEFEKIEFDSGVNILVGKNGQGKTNILEAVSFCSVLKSFRAAKEEQLIRFGCDSARIQIEYLNQNNTESIEIIINKDGNKLLKHNGMTVLKNRELIGNFLSILFTPDHLNLIKEGPNKRRSFLDMALCSLDIKYTDALLRYQKILSQRNALLKKENVLEDLLEIYDRKLAHEGAYIANARARYIEKLENFAKIIFGDISKSQNKLKLLYINQFSKTVENCEQIEKAMYERYAKTHQTDIMLKMTTSGIQKDDLLILQNGKSLKYFGSQGQIRSAVLSLILAQADVIHDKYGEYPVIILDDILSELDRARQKYIFLGTRASQVLVSTCETQKARGKGKIIKVSGGKII